MTTNLPPITVNGKNYVLGVANALWVDLCLFGTFNGATVQLYGSVDGVNFGAIPSATFTSPCYVSVKMNIGSTMMLQATGGTTGMSINTHVN